MHTKLLDLISVKYLEDIKPLFNHVKYTILEDRVFDLDGLDHPGGLFIFNQIKGREISRYFYGNQCFDLFGKPLKIQHKHSAFAENFLERR